MAESKEKDPIFITFDCRGTNIKIPYRIVAFSKNIKNECAKFKSAEEPIIYLNLNPTHLHHFFDFLSGMDNESNDDLYGLGGMSDIFRITVKELGIELSEIIKMKQYCSTHSFMYSKKN